MNMKTYYKSQQKLFKSIQTALNKKVMSLVEVADWQLKVMIAGAKPVWIAFDSKQQGMQTVGRRKNIF